MLKLLQRTFGRHLQDVGNRHQADGLSARRTCPRAVCYVFFFITGSALAQNPIQISGVVTNSSQTAIPGVNILIQGSTVGTVTDVNGQYTIEAPGGGVLVFSFIGMESQEVPVANRSRIDVILQEDVSTLDEVVVVGYGTQEKANLTGSLSSVSGEDLVKRNVGQTSAALQGIIPGVTVTQSSGQPGSDGGSIRIRGIGTLGDANPLVLIDGVPGDINNVDPNIIDNITVLKDAASSSIYGTRAANGVILITTKRGTKDTFSLSYSGYVGWQEATNLKQRVSALDHMRMINMANVNVGRSPIFTDDVISNYPSLHASDPVTYPDTDWNKEIFTENGFTQNHLLNFNAGSEKIKIMGALGYYDQEGIIANTGFERYSLRINTDIDISPKLRIKADAFLRVMNSREPGLGVKQTLFYANHIASIEPTINEFGYAVPSTGSNPLAVLNDGGYIKTITPSIMTNLGFTYKFTDDIHLDFNYTPHFWDDSRKSFRKIVNVYYPNGDLFAPGSQVATLREESNKSLQNNIWATFNMKKSFAMHNVKLLLGASQEDYHNRWFSAFRDNFALPRYDVINAGASSNQQAEGSGSDWALQSLFGRINYDFNNRYLFEANFRYDGSSRFSEGHRFGFFPSFSAGWRISEESFWSSLSGAVPDMKLRASWGELGNQNIGTYPFDSFLVPTTHVFNGQTINGLRVADMANQQISWETARMLNIGVDLGLIGNFSMTFDYYVKETNGILLRLDVPTIIGLNPPYQNAGVVENKGWDVGLNYRGKSGHFSYSFDVVMSDVKNEIIDLKGVNVEGLIVNFEGHPMNSFYGYEAIGYFQNENEINESPAQFGNVIPGGIKYKDQDGNGIIDGKDRIIMGNQIPRYTYSLNSNLAWRNLDFNVLLQGVGKADGYLYGTAVMPFTNGSTALEMHKDYWTPENTDAQFPSLTFNESNNIQNSSFWLKDASYLRVKNIQLGYTIPREFLGVIGINSIRIYVSGQNLFTFDNFYDGFDVEAPVGVGDYYPQVKTYTAGINVNF